MISGFSSGNEQAQSQLDQLVTTRQSKTKNRFGDLLGKNKESISPNVPKALATRSARSWEVKVSPFKKHMVGGRMVPTLRGFLSHKPRRISLEIKGPTDKAQSCSSLRSLDVSSDAAESLLEDEIIVLCVWRSAPKADGDLDEGGYETDYSHESVSFDEMQWKLRKEYALEDISVLKQNGKIFEMKLGSGNDLVVRDFKFDSAGQAEAFQETFHAMESMLKERAKQQAFVFKARESGNKRFFARGPRFGIGGSREKLNAQRLEFQDVSSIQILIEIVSASNLPAIELTPTDPYVIVRMGGKEIHRTDYIARNTDPIWTLDQGSLFLLEMSPEDFFSCSGGMSFVVKDYDALGSNPTLGNLTVPLHALLDGKGKRKSYPLEVGAKSTRKIQKSGDNRKLYLRFKRASESDVEFMNLFKNNKKKAEIYLSETYLPLRYPQSKILKGQKKKGKSGDTLYRVKPFPDPNRQEETKWMTEEQIHSEAQKPSTHWVEAGSGSLFKVYFEVIGCDDLPNMDATTLNVVDKTDTFASIAFEDALVNTDIIGNSLSPRWMPWCYRAFVFNVSHPSSDILLALFDYDPESSPAQLLSRAASDLHDRIGRVRINIAKFLPDTTYNLTYPVFLGGEVDKHRKQDRGKLHVRLRIECKDARKAVVAGLRPPKPSYLAVARQVDFEVSRYTVDGASKGLDKFSMPRFTGYIDELQSYQMLQETVLRAALVVWLWRGHFRIRWHEREFMIPLHSMIAYSWGILVTWDFNLLFPFIFFSIGWAMLASNENMNQHPSRWHQSRGYLSILRLLLLNSTSSECIPANENVEAIEVYSKEAEIGLEKWRRRKQYNRAAKKSLRNELRDKIGLAREEIDIRTSKSGFLKGGVNVNPLNSVLFPFQRRLRRVVVFMRVVKSIFLWEETYYAFWITTAAFLVSIVSLFVPWGFVIKWTLRFAVWVLLGPWMTFVDRYYFFESQGTGKETDEWGKRWKRQQLRITRKAKKKRIRKEHALKLKAMMRFCFGKYLVSIPRFNEELFQDNPLPQSSAEPYIRQAGQTVEVAEKKYGQMLSGNMVMKRQVQVTSEASKQTQPKKRRKWKRRRRSGSGASVDYSEEGSVASSEPEQNSCLDSEDGERTSPPIARRRNRSRDGPRRIWRNPRKDSGETQASDAEASPNVSGERTPLLASDGFSGTGINAESRTADPGISVGDDKPGAKQKSLIGDDQAAPVGGKPFHSKNATGKVKEADKEPPPFAIESLGWTAVGETRDLLTSYEPSI